MRNSTGDALNITRMQTGVRLDARLLVLAQQAAVEKQESLGELIEEAVLHAFEGNGACVRFSETLRQQACAWQLAGTSAVDPQSSAVRTPRVQVGFKIEQRLLKVLKAVAELHDLTPGQLLERILYHQFMGIGLFTADDVARINVLKMVYRMEYDTHACYRFLETSGTRRKELTCK